LRFNIVDAMLFWKMPLSSRATSRASTDGQPVVARMERRHGHCSSSQRSTTKPAGDVMPIVNIQITREGTRPEYTRVTREQKAQLIEGVSKLLLDVLNKPMNSTFVVIDEVDVENWGWGGLPVEEYRKLMAALGPSSRY
jgi:4-oxalocrotonate tautomerase